MTFCGRQRDARLATQTKLYTDATRPVHSKEPMQSRRRSVRMAAVLYHKEIA
jgi:hypothetical protein